MTKLEEYSELLAKCPKDLKCPTTSETLIGHSLNVLIAFEALFGTLEDPTRLMRAWLRFFRLDSAAALAAFLRNGLAACLLHDVGKGNGDFQRAVRSQGYAQIIRHEHLTGALLSLEPVRLWLRDTAELDVSLVVSATATHHLKAEYESFGEPCVADRRSFLVYPQALYDACGSLASHLGVAKPPVVVTSNLWSFDRAGFDAREAFDQARELIQGLRRTLRDDAPRHRLLMALRAALIVADGAGSALPRLGLNLQEWITSAFGERGLIDGVTVEASILSPRTEFIRRTKGSFVWKDFQLATGSLGERVLLLSSCGSGKTLAAWQWIRAQTHRHPVSRVIFLYPTRGTATEGFRDYVSWAPEADAALVHGTAEYDLDSLFDNPQDARYGRDYTTDDRLFALAYWHRRIFSATVDQFFGFMQHVYRSECLLPILADSVIVIDEVHSFDEALFSALCSFLRAFSVPVLCMTASLPASRSRRLEACGLKVFPEVTSDSADLERRATMPRYFVRRLNDASEALANARAATADGRRVLWVVNTVDRCQRLSRELNALCYHSRFRLVDRNRRHRDVVEAFQSTAGPVCAITTQVCEMSLDLDADTLITEWAPVTSLIQRMGRCNRHAEPGCGRLGQVYLYPPVSEAPYEPDELRGASEFVSAVDGHVVTQAELQTLMPPVARAEVDRYTAFLEGYGWASSREQRLRDGVDYTTDAVLEQDLAAVQDSRRRRQPIDGLVLPVPRKLARPDPRLGPRPMLAFGGTYDADFGFVPEESTR